MFFNLGIWNKKWEKEFLKMCQLTIIVALAIHCCCCSNLSLARWKLGGKLYSSAVFRVLSTIILPDPFRGINGAVRVSTRTRSFVMVVAISPMIDGCWFCNLEVQICKSYRIRVFFVFVMPSKYLFICLSQYFHSSGENNVGLAYQVSIQKGVLSVKSK